MGRVVRGICGREIRGVEISLALRGDFDTSEQSNHHGMGWDRQLRVKGSIRGVAMHTGRVAAASSPPHRPPHLDLQVRPLPLLELVLVEEVVNGLLPGAL